jgi:hypothetical protein
MGVTYGNKAIKVFTKTKHFKKGKNSYDAKIYGVIEGPVNQMLKLYSTEFKFMRHETKLEQRKSRKKKEEENK